VRVRQSDLDAFLAQSEARHEQLEADDPWAKVIEAAKAATAAARRQDREAFERAITVLTVTAEALPPTATAQ